MEVPVPVASAFTYGSSDSRMNLCFTQVVSTPQSWKRLWLKMSWRMNPEVSSNNQLQVQQCGRQIAGAGQALLVSLHSTYTPGS